MATRIPDEIPGRPLAMLVTLGAVGTLSDGQLLERFNADRGESSELAFAALVERHGPMVLRVARSLLPDRNDADDAFQATFLVLAGRARRLWVRDSLGPWLHQTAHRTARCLRATAARRRRLDLRIARADEAPEPTADHDDLARTLHEEIDRLPERFRIPVVLCDLEGRTHEQAARALGWAVGTVKSRQARARQRLGEQLRRRGLAPGATLLGPNLAAVVPEALIHQTVVAALRFPLSRAVAPGAVAALARGVLRSMSLTPWIKIASVGLAVGLTTAGVGWATLGAGDAPAQDPPPHPAAPRAVPPPERPAQEEAIKTAIPREEALKDAIRREKAARTAIPRSKVVTSFAVQPGRFQRAILESGTVRNNVVAEGISEVEGGTTLMAIKPDGARVHKGEVVAELDSSSLKDQFLAETIAESRCSSASRLAQTSREVAESAFKDFVDVGGPRALQDYLDRIADAEARLDKGRARRDRAQQARTRADEISRTRTGPETVADAAANLTIDDLADALDLELAALRRELERARTQEAQYRTATMPRTRKSLEAAVGQARLDVLARESEWALSRARVAKLERQIQRCTMRATHDGQVVYYQSPQGNAPPIELGANVRERRMLYKLVDPAHPYAMDVVVPEDPNLPVTPGQKVRFFRDGRLSHNLSGVVASVSDRKTNIGPENTQFHFRYVRINLDPPIDGAVIPPGSLMSVSILFDEADDVVFVPVSSLMKHGDSDEVMVVKEADPSQYYARKVTLGVNNGEYVEIKEGLRPGERVWFNTEDSALPPAYRPGPRSPY